MSTLEDRIRSKVDHDSHIRETLQTFSVSKLSGADYTTEETAERLRECVKVYGYGDPWIEDIIKNLEPSDTDDPLECAREIALAEIDAWERSQYD